MTDSAHGLSVGVAVPRRPTAKGEPDRPSCKVSRWMLLDRALRRLVIRAAVRRHDTSEALVDFCAPNDLIGIEVLCSGGFEREVLSLLKAIVLEHIARGCLDRMTTVGLDVGANIGTHALFFSTFLDRVLAFEPNPPVALVCRANQLSAARPNVEVFDVALSDRAGDSFLFTPKVGNFGWGSLEEGHGPDIPVPVRTETADHFLLPRLAPDQRVVLLKIDVEGHEEKVFYGARELLLEHEPVVVFESLSRDHLLSCKAILESFGYTRFGAVLNDWERKRSRLVKLASILLGRTGVSLQPIDCSGDEFYACVVAQRGCH